MSSRDIILLIGLCVAFIALVAYDAHAVGRRMDETKDKE